MLKWLSSQIGIHNANQPRGQGIKVYTQTNLDVCYLVYAHHIGDKRIRKGLGVGIPTAASVSDQKKLWQQAQVEIGKLARDPEKLAANSLKNKPTTQAKPTLKNLLTEWLEIKKITNKSIWNPTSAAKNLEEYFGAVHDITTIDSDDILLYEGWLKTEKKYKPHTVFCVMSNSRTFFCWCHKKGHLTKQVEIHCARGKTNPNEVALSDQELEALRKAECPNIHLKNLFLLGCNVGTRKCDLKRLTFRDFGDVVNGVLIIRNIVSYEQNKLQHKENSKAKIFLTDESKRIILDQWERSPRKLEAKVFEFSNKEQVNAWDAWTKAAKIERPIRVSGLRHTAATRLRRAGCDARTIQRLIGWSSLAQLDAVYMGDDDGQLLASAGKIKQVHLNEEKAILVEPAIDCEQK